MTRTAFRALLTLVFLVGSVAMGQARPTFSVCGSYKNVAKRLEARFGETRHNVGWISNRYQMETWVRKSGVRIKRTWTILIRRDDDYTCLLSSGRGFNDRPINVDGSL